MTARRRLVLGVLGVAAALYGVVALDVVWRARHAYLEGEKAANPRDAYAWYESAAHLFTPPESKWSKAARQKMPIVKERWKADLKAKGISVDEKMLE